MTRDDDNALGVVVLGGGVAAASALAWGAANRRADTSTTRAQLWVHPVPTLDARLAVVSNPFRARASDDGKATQHLGVDLMYRRRDARDLIAAFPPRTVGGTPLFFMPENIPALVASAGVVTFASMTPVGNTVIVRHANGWATYYTHLATLAVRKGAVVDAGETLGTIGASPKDSAHLRHLLCAAAHNKCNAERLVMRSRRCRCAIACNGRRSRLHITVASRRSR